MKTRYPTPRKGEQFIGNQKGNKPQDHLRHVEGLRLASPAYDLDGKKIPGYFAMMASPYAYAKYNSIMEARLSATRRGATSRH